MEILLEPDHEIEFDRINDSLGMMIFKVFTMIESAIPSVGNLISFITTLRPNLDQQLSNAKSIDDVKTVIRNNCSITNTVLLESIVNHYSVAEAKELISEFNSEIEEFCERNICDVQIRKISSLTCETIIFVVDWEVTRCTLKNIERLHKKAFQKLNKKVEVVATKQVNSIAIICYAPYNLMEKLALEAKGSISDLIEMGLMQLTIGYDTVYSKCEVSITDHYNIYLYSMYRK